LQLHTFYQATLVQQYRFVFITQHLKDSGDNKEIIDNHRKEKKFKILGEAITFFKAATSGFHFLINNVAL